MRGFLFLLFLSIPMTVTAAVPGTQPSVLSDKVVLRDTAGQPVRPIESVRGAGTVLLFVRHECPISNSYAPEVNRIVKEFGGEGKEQFRFYFIHIDQDLTAEQAARHAKDFGYTAPVLLDTQRLLVKQVSAKVTPEAVVITPAGNVAYQGRIDDKWVGYGRSRAEPTTRSLRIALDEVRAGKPVTVEQKPSIGCPIE